MVLLLDPVGCLDEGAAGHVEDVCIQEPLRGCRCSLDVIYWLSWTKGMLLPEFGCYF